MRQFFFLLLSFLSHYCYSISCLPFLHQLSLNTCFYKLYMNDSFWHKVYYLMAFLLLEFTFLNIPNQQWNLFIHFWPVLQLLIKKTGHQKLYHHLLGHQRCKFYFQSEHLNDYLCLQELDLFKRIYTI
jgi:hypothetical protein